jgi:bla regulator protein BlaR1
MMSRKLAMIHMTSLIAAGCAVFTMTLVAFAQTNVTAKADAGNRPLAFEVVSIRPSKPGGGAQQIGPTPDGYHMKSLFMVMPLLTAYVPTEGDGALYGGDQLVGSPDWVINDAYDIDAKVGEADLADWQDPARQPVMLRAMLQSMLEDRLKLVMHRGTKVGSMYSLVVGKNGPKFQETKPGEAHPGGFMLPGGGVVVSEVQDDQIITHFYEFSMPRLASALSGTAGRPVQDKTGLTGKYDFVEQKPMSACAPHCGQEGPGPTEETEPSIFTMVQEQLGLKLEPSKGQVETLVIDHVERPSEN